MFNAIDSELFLSSEGRLRGWWNSRIPENLGSKSASRFELHV